MSIKRLLLFASLLVSTASYADNPLIRTMYTADPTARVINGQLFVFPSSDVPPVKGKGINDFYMPFYHVFSSTNLFDWTDYGKQIDQNDIPWGEPDSYALWAPCCIEKKGKYYYYFPAKPKGDKKGNHAIGMAIANKPGGPYKVEKTPMKGVTGIDPNVFIDDDGTAYLYWGSGEEMLGCKLKPNMKELDGEPVSLGGLPQMYKEAAFMFKKDGKYYFTYSHTTIYRTCELSYSMGDSPLGPFEYKGAFMKRWKDCWTNHHSIVEYNGEWMLFYHHKDISNEQRMRSICADYIHFNSDGTIQEVTPTTRGVGLCAADREIQIDRYSEISDKGAKITRLGKDFPANWVVSECKEGGWVRYNRVDFSGKDYKSVRIRSAAKDGKSAKTVEIRENGYFGKVLAKVNIPSTNATDDFITTTVNLDYAPTGVVDLYFMFSSEKEATFDIDWVQFSDKNANADKSLVDFFLPMEPQSALVTEGIWGNKNVLPRDIKNGLEDHKIENWCYWDGGIVKDDEGKYHLYCSRWGQEFSHSVGWHEDSKGVHAVSDNIMGPYEDKGLVFPYREGGKGHNVYGLRLHDGRYAVVTSEITDGEIHVSDNPDGPFEFLGKIEVDLNGFEKGLAFYTMPNNNHMSNVQIRQHPKGGYMLIARSTAIMYSKKDILGPYKVMTDRVYKDVPELAKRYNEDPTMWYSGGLYHIVYNHWPSKISHHFTSKDGVSDWTYRGEAFNRGESKIFKYTDGTINDWEFIERPTAYVENGHVTHFIFSVIDVHKGQDGANDNHASKIVVVPFDGVAFDKYMEKYK